MIHPKWIGRTAFLASAVTMGINSPFIVAQEPQIKVIETSAKRCTCGRWTCPICQQRKMKEVCPPGQVVPILPSAPMPADPNVAPPQFHLDDGVPTPNAQPSPSDGSSNVNPSMPNAPGTLDPNLGNQLSQSDRADVARSLNADVRGGDQSRFLASNSSLADPGLFGDFFGPTSNVNSVISQNYVFENVPGSFNGVGYDFDIPNVGAVNDITGVGSASLLTLLPPSPQDDIVRPTAPGWQYGQGTATLVRPATPYTPTTPASPALYRLQYSFLNNVTVPSSFAQQRMKLAENTSPIPQNRVFVNYSLFQNVPLENGINVNRISPGFETLLLSQNTSFEMRTPIATTLSSDIIAGGVTNSNQVEFGNMFFSLKQVVWRGNKTILSSGLSMTVPTADAIRIFSAGQEIYRINNQSVHLMPFLGGYYKPSNRTFLQGVLQVDIDANGNTVKSRPNYNDPRLTTIGRLQDLNLLYLDTGVGYWAYRNSGRGLTGIAPMLEAHYNRSLSQADCVVDSNGTRIQLPIQQFDNINIVAATVFEINQRSRLGIGYGAPIGNGTDRAFDGEFRATFNRYY